MTPLRVLVFVVAVIACVIAPGCATDAREASPAAAAARRPNILFIMADDHAAHAIGSYGSVINQTPGIDRLAREGMRFANCFCENSLCSPSRAAILTGQFSARNGVPDLSHPLPRDRVIFPHLLRDSGYQSAVIGKWHLHRNPTGFDHFEVFPDQGDYHDPVMIRGGPDGKGTRAKFTGYATDLVTDKSIEWLKARDKERPFVLLSWHKAPHRHWEPPKDPKYARLFEDADIPLPATFDDDYATRTNAARRQTMSIDKDLNATDLKQPPPSGLSAAELKRWKYQRYIKDYLRCVASLDDNVARMLDYLDQSGLSENTIVVYTSDQGFFLGDHGWYDKRFMYEEALRMPLLVRYPGRVKPGSVCDRMVMNIDFAPTLLELAGVPTPAAMQGESIVPLLEGRTPQSWRTATYYHYYEAGPPHNVTPHEGIRTERYKLIRFLVPGNGGVGEVGGWELYDLFTDPQEVCNLYGRSGYEELTGRLKTELATLREQSGERAEEPGAR